MGVDELEQLQIRVGEWTFDALAAGPADGPVVVLLHGFPESMDEWRAVMPALAAAGYRAVALQQRGYSPGARPPAVEDYHHTRLVADVVGVADALGAERIDLVGHDWGALVAWSAAASAPERLRSLTIVSVPHPRAFAEARASDPDQQEKSAYIAFFKTPDAPEATFLADDAAGLRRAFEEIAPDVADAHVRTLTDPGAMTAALNYYRAWDDSLDQVGDIAVPTLFIWSTDDVALGRTAAEATERYVTGPYRFEVLEGLSHWLPEVAPDQVADLLLDHLERTADASR